MPASLAVFDDKKNYIGNLLEWKGGSRSLNVPDDWINIPSGSYVGTTISERSGQLDSKRLLAGTYYLQMIYNKSFIAPQPNNRKQVLEFYKKFDESELFRSNVLQIKLVETKPNK